MDIHDKIKEIEELMARANKLLEEFKTEKEKEFESTKDNYKF